MKGRAEQIARARATAKSGRVVIAVAAGPCFSASLDIECDGRGANVSADRKNREARARKNRARARARGEMHVAHKTAD